MPLFIGQFIEFAVAMKRIQTFLLCEEIVPSIIENNEDGLQMKEDPSFIIKYNSNYHWGYISPED